jgi:methylated-DNA-protein-cysteine methyltransferase related protein
MKKVRSATPAGSSGYGEIWAVVRRIPRGRVATYGQVAVLAGRPGHARQVGYAMYALPEDSDVPWQRVVNARGEISLRSEPGGHEGWQRHLLEEEGVTFDERGRIDLEVFGWDPDARPGPRRPGRGSGVRGRAGGRRPRP